MSCPWLNVALAIDADEAPECGFSKVLNLNRRKLNHHEEVYSRNSIPDDANCEQELDDAGNAAAIASQSAGSAATAVDNWASKIVH